LSGSHIVDVVKIGNDPNRGGGAVSKVWFDQLKGSSVTKKNKTWKEKKLT
jgi:hypothetical protein